MNEETRSIPLLAVFPRDYSCMPEDVRANLRKASGYFATEDGRIFDERGRRMPVRKRYGDREWVVLHMHDTDAELASDIAWGRISL